MGLTDIAIKKAKGKDKPYKLSDGDGLGFKMKHWWIPDQADGQDDYKPDGRIRWCWLQLGEAAIMLLEFLPERHPKEARGTGINVCFQCEDALALYREFRSREI
jgi:lactoylglutathione lyase